MSPDRCSPRLNFDSRGERAIHQHNAALLAQRPPAHKGRHVSTSSVTPSGKRFVCGSNRHRQARSASRDDLIDEVDSSC